MDRSAMTHQRTVILTVLCLLSGCTMMPAYHRPQAPVASQWPDETNTALGQAPGAQAIKWQTFFKDPRLQRLIEIALENNRDFRVAALNVEALQAQYRIGAANGIPSVDAVASALKQRQPLYKSQPFRTSALYNLGFILPSYEVDFFGRIRSLKAQALENYLAGIEAQRNARISLMAQVAIEYLNTLQLDEQLALTLNVLKSQKAYYTLIKQSYMLGKASEIDLRSSQAQVAAARVNVASLSRQRKIAQDALVLLLGGSLPKDLPAGRSFLSQAFLEDLSPGLVSDLLQRRPDILQAEHQLKAANANIGAARAAFFPRILLTGSSGTASVALSSLFTGSVWSFSPQVTLPIFDAGINKANLDLAQISKRVEIAQYEKAIQKAFKEVADALMARATYNDQLQAQQDLVSSQQKRYDLADVRYRSGIDSYLNVLLAQQDLYAAQANLINLRFNKLANLVTLYLALGGGWSQR